MTKLEVEPKSFGGLCGLVKEGHLMAIIGLRCGAQVAEDTNAFEKLLVAKGNDSGDQCRPVFDGRAIATQTGVNLEVHPGHLAG